MTKKIKRFDNHPAVMNIPTKSSSGDEWIEWHKILKNSIGKKNANILWVKAWNMRAGKGSSASTSNLRSYIREQGIDIDKTAFETITGGLSGGIDFFGDIFKAGTYISIGLVSLVGLGIVVAVFNIAKDSSSIAKDVTKGYLS